MMQTRRATRLTTKDETEHQPADIQPLTTTTRPLKRARRADERVAVATEHKEFEHDGPTKPPRKPRRRKDEAGTKPSDFVSRTSSLWKVGAHVSAAGGVENTIVNAARVGANAFALFVKSQRKWSSPPLTDENVASFKARMDEFEYDPKYVLPHGSYLINLGNPDEAKREKSYECFLDDLQRCERLGLRFYNFHPGSTVGNATKEESISFIARCLNRAHKETSSVITVIENMSGAKNIIGSRFAELKGIIDRVEDKSRVGVCLDTCHLYAAGYDISTQAGWDETMVAFDEQVGLSYLRGMHLNDSKTPLGSKKDRHENIGIGTLGISAFLTILSDPRVQDMPLILETPTFEAEEMWECEVKVLNCLSKLGVDPGKDDSEAERERTLKDLVGDIRNAISEYCDHKGKNGKKSIGKKATTSGTKARKRKITDVESEDEVTGSEGEPSCAGHSE